jgi:tetratricopeptide (TPR) repeat protein
MKNFKFTKGNITFIVIIAVSIGLNYVGLDPLTNVIIMVATLLIAYLINRSSIFFIRGNLALSSKKEKKHVNAWKYYRKAFAIGHLSEKYITTAASFFIQLDDVEFGMKQLDGVIEKTQDNETRQIAKIQKSMALQRQGKLDEAIDTLNEVRESKYKSLYLSVNLSSYLIFAGRYDEARTVLDEGAEYINQSAGLFDNKGWLDIVAGKWKDASKLYTEMLDRGPRFPDPYLHAAQVKLHYGKIEEAVTLLNISLTKKWNETSLIKKDMVEEFIKNLSDEDKKVSYAHLIDQSPIEVARGEAFNDVSDIELKKLIDAGFAKEPKTSIDTDALAHKVVTRLDEDDVDVDLESIKDTTLPQTDLTEEDQKWLLNHPEED